MPGLSDETPLRGYRCHHESFLYVLLHGSSPRLLFGIGAGSSISALTRGFHVGMVLCRVMKRADGLVSANSIFSIAKSSRGMVGKKVSGSAPTASMTVRSSTSARGSYESVNLSSANNENLAVSGHGNGFVERCRAFSSRGGKRFVAAHHDIATAGESARWQRVESPAPHYQCMSHGERLEAAQVGPQMEKHVATAADGTIAVYSNYYVYHTVRRKRRP